MFMIQHYIEKVAERDHVVGFSPNSIFFLNDTDYVISQITWDLKLAKLDDARCELSCSVISETENEAFATPAQCDVEGCAAGKYAAAAAH